MPHIREDRPDAVVCMRIVGKTVKEDDGKAVRGPVLVIRDLEDRRAHGFDGRRWLEPDAGERHRARALQEISSLHDGAHHSAWPRLRSLRELRRGRLVLSQRSCWVGYLEAQIASVASEGGTIFIEQFLLRLSSGRRAFPARLTLGKLKNKRKATRHHVCVKRCMHDFPKRTVY